MGVFWQISAVEPKLFDELFRQTDGKFLIAVKIRLRQILVLTYVYIIFRSYYCIYLLTTPLKIEVGFKSKNTDPVVKKFDSQYNRQWGQSNRVGLFNNNRGRTLQLGLVVRFV